MKWSGCVVNGDSLLLRFPLTGLDEYFPAFKDIICALMELADQALNCCRIVVCVDKHLARQGLGRSFKTCGFHLMHPSRFSLKEDCMLFSFEF